MSLTSATKWRMTINWLRRNFRTNSYGASVRSVAMKDFGDTSFCEDDLCFAIRVKKNLPFATKLDTLLHEYAHVLSWHCAEAEKEDHSAEWGIAYALIYRTFLEWDYGREFKPLPGQQEFNF